MKKTELTEYSEYLAREYYKNNIQPFLDAFSEKCLWIGPAQGQMIRTKKALLAAFAKESNQLVFSLQNLQVIPMPVGAEDMDVLLTYTVITYYPSGESIVFRQRAEFLWTKEPVTDADGKSTKEYAILVCHISNEYPYDTRDNIYPNHFTELDIAGIYAGKLKMCKFPLRGINHSYFYLSGETILWMESRGTHTTIHTVNSVYESVENINAITKKYSDVLIKVHASYAINPMFASAVGRFYVRMEDGAKISIPERKYTKTRDEINRRIEKNTISD